jgi:6-phosphogluconolactonase (cycloisomerase 2 family)
MSFTTRRRFLQEASTWAAVAPLAARAQPASSRRIVAYAGTYSSPAGSGRGEGIHLLEMDPSTGAFTERDVVKTTANPTWLVLDRTRTHLYAANEVAAPETGAGTVTAYSIDRATGRLTLLNSVSSEGAGPAHLSLHPAGKHALVANYGGGTVAVLPIQAEGRLGAASDVKRHQGTTGPARASSAPPGSFAISGHDRPHAHMVESDASGRFVFAADLGLDQILIWRFDDAKGSLTPNDPPSVALPPGDGPRHFAFHPKGRWFYSLQEEASTVVAFDYDAANGRLSAKQTISTLPRGFAGTNFTSGIVVSPDARFVYVANRLHDSIAWLSIGGDGTLTWTGEEWTRGDYPRSFTFDPTGRFLFSCNQRSDAIASFRVDARSGRLTFTGQYTPIGSPSHLVFLG